MRGSLRIITIEREVSDGGKYHEADKHPEGTEDERFATAEVLNNVEADESRSEVDATQNHLCHIGVVDTCELQDQHTFQRK